MRPDRQPQAEYFEVMAHSASTHWWYEARRALFAQLLSGRIPPGATALDIGCGTGETLALLRSLGAKRVAGTDLSAHALGHAKAFLEAEAPPTALAWRRVPDCAWLWSRLL